MTAYPRPPLFTVRAAGGLLEGTLEPLLHDETTLEGASLARVTLRREVATPPSSR